VDDVYTAGCRIEWHEDGGLKYVPVQVAKWFRWKVWRFYGDHLLVHLEMDAMMWSTNRKWTRFILMADANCLLGSPFMCRYKRKTMQVSTRINRSIEWTERPGRNLRNLAFIAACEFFWQQKRMAHADSDENALKQLTINMGEMFAYCKEHIAM